MLTEDLFGKILISPAIRHDVDRLQIVSGYATASMADRHIESLAYANIGRAISIELIVGMTRHNGIAKAQHYALQKLVREHSGDINFLCSYVVNGNPIHAKTYCWLSGDEPRCAFAGSANYTLTAFGRSQIEAMAEADGNAAAEFYAQSKINACDCQDDEIENKVVLTETKHDADQSADSVTLSLLVRRTGDTPAKSGINWGQRHGRDSNQAYINIPVDISSSGFFPERQERFTVLTDDGYSFIMVRAQTSGKGLHTTQDNALLGKYLRTRMRLPDGEYVTRDHLVRYGRTDVTFTKIDDETYLMDFRPNMGPGEDLEGAQE